MLAESRAVNTCGVSRSSRWELRTWFGWRVKRHFAFVDTLTLIEFCLFIFEWGGCENIDVASPRASSTSVLESFAFLTAADVKTDPDARPNVSLFRNIPEKAARTSSRSKTCCAPPLPLAHVISAQLSRPVSRLCSALNFSAWKFALLLT